MSEDAKFNLSLLKIKDVCHSVCMSDILKEILINLDLNSTGG